MRKLALILASLLWATAALAQSTGSITLQQRPIGSGGPTFDDITTYANGKFQILDPLKYDFVGDSRTRDIFPSTCNSGAEPVSNCGTRGTNWFVIANALSGSRYKIGLDQAIIGTRPDQYLAPTNIAPMLASNAGNFVIGYPIINSLTPLNGANYTDTNGYTITPSNVANVNAANILAATKSAIAANKKVILQLEPGNPTITNSAIGVSSFTGQTSGLVLTVTAVASGVIYTPQTVTVNSLTGQLQSDPGSQILSGAGVTAGTLITAQLTGFDGATCPSVSCTGGNQFTVAITTSGADTYRLFPTAPANNFWNLTDYLQGNYIVNVAAGSSHCRIYAGLDYATAVNTRTTYANFSADDVASNGGSVDGPTTAYTMTLRTIPNAAQTNGGSTKSFTRYILYAQMSAAGNCTFTVSRPWFSRVRVYNPVTGTFSG